MNSASYACLFAKDSRAAWPWIASFWLLAALPCLPRLLSPLPNDNLAHWMGIAWWFQLAMGTVAVARLVQMDSFRDPRGFLRTRPMARLPILASKLGTVLVWLVIPAGLFQVAAYLALGFQLDPADNALAFMDAALMMAAPLFLAVLPALLTRQLGYCLLISIAAWIGVEILSEMAINRYPRGPLSWVGEEWGQMRTSAALAAQVSAIAGAVVIALLHARTPSMRPLLISALVLGAAILAVWTWWPVNFVARFAESDPQAPRAEWPEVAAASWPWKSPDNYTPLPSFSGGTYDGVRVKDIAATFETIGLPEPWYVRASFVTSAIHLENGTVFPQSRHFSYPILVDPLLKSWGADLGYTLQPFMSATLQKYRVDQIVPAPHRAVVKGSVTVEIRRAVVLAEIPARVGAHFVWGRKRFTVRKIVTGGGAASVEVAMETAAIRFRTSAFDRGSWNNVVWLLWNAELKQAGHSNGGSEGIVVGGPYTLREARREFQLRSTKPGEFVRDLPPSWLEGATIRLVTSEFGGTKTLPFAFGPLELAE